VSADTDAVADATPQGAEVSYVLRSAQSPQTQTLSFELQAGWSLAPSAADLSNISVLNASGVVEGTVMAATALDAQGQIVPASYQVQGSDQLLLTVADQGGGYAFPIDVDPGFVTATTSTNMFNNWQWTADPSSDFSALGNPWQEILDTAGVKYAAGQRGQFTVFAGNGNIYKMQLTDVNYAPDDSDFVAGIENPSLVGTNQENPWYSGSWQNTTKNTSGTVSGLTDANALGANGSGNNLTFCAASCGSNPSYDGNEAAFRIYIPTTDTKNTTANATATATGVNLYLGDSGAAPSVYVDSAQDENTWLAPDPPTLLAEVSVGQSGLGTNQFNLTDSTNGANLYTDGPVNNCSVSSASNTVGCQSVASPLSFGWPASDLSAGVNWISATDIGYNGVPSVGGNQFWIGVDNSIPAFTPGTANGGTLLPYGGNDAVQPLDGGQIQMDATDSLSGIAAVQSQLDGYGMNPNSGGSEACGDTDANGCSAVSTWTPEPSEGGWHQFTFSDWNWVGTQSSRLIETFAEIAPPTISGPSSYGVGDTLTANAAPFQTNQYGMTSSPTVTGWQWESCPDQTSNSCVPIPGATESQYTLSNADVGSTVVVSETLNTPSGSYPSTMTIGSTQDLSDVVEPAAGQTCTDEWVASGGTGAWNTPGDWSTGSVPGPNDVACVPAGYSNSSGPSDPSIVTVSPGSQLRPVLGLDAYGASLTVDGGATLTVSEQTPDSGAGDLTLGDSTGPGSLSVAGGFSVQGVGPSGSISGGLDWVSGAILGGGTVTLDGFTSSEIDPAASSDSLVLNGTSLVNKGALDADCTVANDATNSLTLIAGENGAKLDNEGYMWFALPGSAGPSFGCEFQQAVLPPGGTPSTFINDNTIAWSGDDDVDAVDIGWQFEDTEAAQVDNAIIDLYGGQVAPTTAQPYTLSGHWNGASLGLESGGAYSITDDLADFGSQNESQAGVTVGSAPGSSGAPSVALAESIAGTGTTPAAAPDLTVSGGTWTYGWIAADGPLTLGASNEVTTISNLADWDSALITLDGTIDVESLDVGGGDIDQQGNALNILGTADLSGPLTETGGSGSTMTFYGTVEVGTAAPISTSGSVDLLGPVAGDGNLSVTTSGGSVYEQGGVTTTGSVTVNAGGDVQLSGAISDTGNVSVVTTGRVDISGSVDATGLTVTGPLVGGAEPSSISIEGNIGEGGDDAPPVDSVSLTSSGSVDVNGQIADNGTLTLSGGGVTTLNSGWTASNEMIVDGEVVDNEGEMWLGSELLAEQGSEIINDGQLQADGVTFQQATGGPASRFVNADDGQLIDWTNPSTPDNTMLIPYSGGGSVSNAYIINDSGSGQYGGNNPAAPDMVAAACDQATDCGNGDWSTSETDLSVAGLGGPLALTRQYSSRLASAESSPGMFGYGWITPFEQRLTVDSVANPATASVQTATGSPATYTLSGSSYVAAAGIYATLTIGSDGPCADITNETTAYTYVQPDQTTTCFNAAGFPIAVSDRQNQITTYSYNSQNQLTEVTAPTANGAGRSITFTYITSGPGTGLVGTATDPAGLVTTYGYDSNDNLVSVAENASPGATSFCLLACQSVWGYQYDKDQGNSAEDYTDLHELTTLTDADGNHTTISYEADYVTGVQQPGKSPEQWTYQMQGTPSDNTGGETIQTSPNGNVTQYYYNNQDEPTSIVHADGSTESYTYYSDNNLETDEDGNLGTTSYWYDQYGNVNEEENPDHEYTYWNYDAERDLNYEELPSGETTTYNSYDAGGEPASVTVSNPNVSGTPSEITLMTYFADEQLETQTTPAPDSGETQYAYDSYGDLESVTGPAGAETTYGYDVDGRQVCETTPRVTALGSVCVNGQAAPAKAIADSYDELGDLNASTNPDGGVTSYTYTPDRQVQQVTAPASNVANVTSYLYESNGQLETTTTGTGSSATTQNDAYDADDNLTTQTASTASGTAIQTYTYTYNDMDQLCWSNDGSVQTPVCSPNTIPSTATAYTHDGDGNVKTITYPANASGAIEQTSYSYNGENQVSTVNYSDHETSVADNYTPDGQLATMTDASGDSTYLYDGLDRLTTVCVDATTTAITTPSQCTGDGGRPVSYAYNTDNDQTSIGYPNGDAVSQYFNAADQLTSVKDWLGNTTSFGYDADSDLLTTTFPTAPVETDNYSYTNNYDDALMGVTMNETGLTSPLASIALTRYPDDLIDTDTQTGLPGPTTDSYAYTEQQELTSDTVGTTASNYSYDAARNMTQLNGSGTGSYAYNSQSELTSSPAGTYGDNALGERTCFTTSGTCANPGTGSETTYSYDADQNLTQVATPSVTVGYVYNGAGQLMNSTQGSTTTDFTWDDTASTPTLLTAGNESYIYGPDGAPIEQISSSGTVQYLHHDQIGSTRLVTSSTGGIADSYTYTPYGALVSGSSSTTGVLLGYAGQYTDPTTGLQYNQARWYDPATGQFMVIDPKVQTTWQPYAYAGGDPLLNADPSGEAASGYVRMVCAVASVTWQLCVASAEDYGGYLNGTGQSIAKEVIQVSEDIQRYQQWKAVVKALLKGEAPSVRIKFDASGKAGLEVQAAEHAEQGSESALAAAEKAMNSAINGDNASDFQSAINDDWGELMLPEDYSADSGWEPAPDPGPFGDGGGEGGAAP
jgi:RHS repeat-associated protein